MKNEKLENWIIIPRKVAYDKRAGIISKNELFILMWLRLNGNPYGITTTSLRDINEDLFENKFTISYINKIILSLRSKRYLYYEDRTGRRGSFDVHFGDWILPDKNIRSLDKYFNNEVVRPVTHTTKPIKEEVGTENTPDIQSVEDIKADISKILGRN